MKNIGLSYENNINWQRDSRFLPSLSRSSAFCVGVFSCGTAHLRYHLQPARRVYRLVSILRCETEVFDYTIEDPARIVIDFPDTQSDLSQRRFRSQEQCISVVVLAAGDRSRLIVNLSNPGQFETAFEGIGLRLKLG